MEHSWLRDERSGFPLVDFGRDPGARLVKREDGAGLQWVWPREDRPDARLVRISERSEEVSAGSSRSLLAFGKLASRRFGSSFVQSAVHLLREKYPEVSTDPVFLKVLSSEIIGDYRECFALNKNGDPSACNTLGVARLNSAGNVLLLTPGGSRQCALYAGRYHEDLKHSQRRRTKVLSFKTQIQQIVLRAGSEGHPSSAIETAVRTSTGTYLIELAKFKDVKDVTEPEKGEPKGAACISKEIAPSGTEGFAHVHISNHLYRNGIVITDERGAIWLCGNGQQYERCNKVVEDDGQLPARYSDRWWRAYFQSDQEVVRASRNTLSLLDCRAPRSAVKLWDSNGSSASRIEDVGSQQLYEIGSSIPILTTDRVVWLDSRMLMRPVLASKHCFHGSGSIHIDETVVGAHPTVLVWSARTGATMGFPTSTTHTGSIISACDPYWIDHSTSKPSRKQPRPSGLQGLSFYRNSDKKHQGESYSMFSLHTDGAVLKDDFVINGQETKSTTYTTKSSSCASDESDGMQSESEDFDYDQRAEGDLLSQYPIENLYRYQRKTLHLGRLRQQLLASPSVDQDLEAASTFLDFPQKVIDAYLGLRPMAVPVSVWQLIDHHEDLRPALWPPFGIEFPVLCSLLCDAVEKLLARCPYSNKAMQPHLKSKAAHVGTEDDSSRISSPDEILGKLSQLERTYALDLILDQEEKALMSRACQAIVLEEYLSSIIIFDEPFGKRSILPNSGTEKEGQPWIKELLSSWAPESIDKRKSQDSGSSDEEAVSHVGHAKEPPSTPSAAGPVLSEPGPATPPSQTSEPLLTPQSSQMPVLLTTQQAGEGDSSRDILATQASAERHVTRPTPKKPRKKQRKGGF